jgi:hypothetical protein
MHTLNDMSHEDMGIGHHYEDVHREHYSMENGGHHVNYNIDPELYTGHHVNDPKYQPNFLPSGKTSLFLSRGNNTQSVNSLYP